MAARPANEMGQRFNPPYLVGAYLAVNAIPDVALLVDGPSCVFAKARLIQGRHDLASTLLACDGRHRVHYTGTDVTRITVHDGARVVEALRRVARQPGIEAVLLGSLPLCSVAGVDYDRLLRDAASDLTVPLLELPGRSLADDWLGGYSAVLEALAKEIDLAGGAPRADRVAVIGYLMDRNEGDHRGNLAELRRMLEALRLEPTAIWPAGESLGPLAAVRDAATLIALPHGRAAARVLARRLGVPVIETGLPLGLAGTRRWLEQVARACDRQAQAEDFIRSELDEVVPRMEWVVEHALVGRCLAYAGDPHYAVPLRELIAEVGGSIAAMFLGGSASHLAEEERAALEGVDTLMFEPLEPAMQEAWRRVEQQGVDLLVTNTRGLELLQPGGPWIEWGYPSHHNHVLQDEPFLGFRGALALYNRMTDAIVQGAAGKGGNP